MSEWETKMLRILAWDGIGHDLRCFDLPLLRAHTHKHTTNTHTICNTVVQIRRIISNTKKCINKSIYLKYFLWSIIYRFYIGIWACLRFSGESHPQHVTIFSRFNYTWGSSAFVANAHEPSSNNLKFNIYIRWRKKQHWSHTKIGRHQTARITNTHTHTHSTQASTLKERKRPVSARP